MLEDSNSSCIFAIIVAFVLSGKRTTLLKFWLLKTFYIVLTSSIDTALVDVSPVFSVRIARMFIPPTDIRLNPTAIRVTIILGRNRFLSRNWTIYW